MPFGTWPGGEDHFENMASVLTTVTGVMNIMNDTLNGQQIC